MRTRRILGVLAIATFAVLGTATAGDEDASTSPAVQAPAVPATPTSPTAAGGGPVFESAGTHCNTPDLGMCEELSTLSGANPMAQENCTSTGGTWGQGECPAANKLGYCDQGTVIAGSRLHYYQSELWADAAAAEEACNNGLLRGTWNATP